MPIPMLNSPIALGDRAILVRFGDAIDVVNFRKVHALLRHFDEVRHPGVVECVPAFTSLTIHYEPLIVSFDEMCSQILLALESLDVAQDYATRVTEIPVCYGGPFGEDLEFVAKHHQLTVDEVISIH